MNGGWGISNEIALRWMPLDLTDDKSLLVQVMAWCRQATSHYLSQCWPRSLSLYGITRPQWVKKNDCQLSSILTEDHDNNMNPGGCCNIRFQSETHYKIKSCKISFIQNIPFSCQITLRLCMEYVSGTTVLRAKISKWSDNWLMSYGQMETWQDLSWRHMVDGHHRVQQPPNSI